MTRTGLLVTAASVIQVAIIVLSVVVLRRTRTNMRQALDTTKTELVASAPEMATLSAPRLVPSAPLHAYQLTAADRACIDMLAGAYFAPHSNITLPSGLVVSGAEMSRWVDHPAHSYTPPRES